MVILILIKGVCWLCSLLSKAGIKKAGNDLNGRGHIKDGIVRIGINLDMVVCMRQFIISKSTVFSAK